MDCWYFGNHCCLCQNDCPPSVTMANSKSSMSLLKEKSYCLLTA